MAIAEHIDARHLPAAWRALSPREFADPRWQLRQAARGIEQVLEHVEELAGSTFAASLAAGTRRASMETRITPHLFSLIDWRDPEHDPIRRQFLPIVEELEPDHPHLTFDPLGERGDSPVPGLVHRYHDRALFLVLDVCPVYCAFCTRSYLVGGASQEASKDSMPIDPRRWTGALEYLRRTPQIKDVILSGGDVWLLAPRHLRRLTTELSKIEHIRRVRLGSRGLGALPTRATYDDEWYSALAEASELMRGAGKRLMIHTHFNHANEVSVESRTALSRLRELPLEVRNHSVLLAGVNDTADAMVDLFGALSDAGTQPYYVFQSDLVPRAEHLRTALSTAIELERAVHGRISGYDIPRFVIDLPSGGGKRGPWSFDSYDRATGISIYSGSAVRPGRFVYVDPLHSLSPEMAQRWVDGEVRIPAEDEHAFAAETRRVA